MCKITCKTYIGKEWYNFKQDVPGVPACSPHRHLLQGDTEKMNLGLTRLFKTSVGHFKEIVLNIE